MKGLNVLHSNVLVLVFSMHYLWKAVLFKGKLCQHFLKINHREAGCAALKKQAAVK